MSCLKIHPLHLGTITRHKDGFGYRLDYGKLIEAPLIAWYIEGASKRILVDTGGGRPDEFPWMAPYMRGEDQEIAAALRNKVGLNCEDIDIVINTHLHWDHCSGNDLFPNAQIFVQEKELASARNPVPVHSFGYIKRFIDGIEYTLISGDREIVDDVSVVLIPGHTEGFQGVLVDAERRRYFIASDSIGLFECLKFTPPLVSGVFVNLRDYYASLEKIAKLSAVILPGHDMKVFEREVYC